MIENPYYKWVAVNLLICDSSFLIFHVTLVYPIDIMSEIGYTIFLSDFRQWRCDMHQTQDDLRKYNYMTSEINGLYHEAAFKSGISDSVQNILYVLFAENYRCLQSEIYKQSGISRQTINSAIRRLEQDGMVYLEQGKGRNTVVCLTDEGICFAREKIESIYRVENEIFAEWSDDEVETYLKLTERYRDALKEKLEKLF